MLSVRGKTMKRYLLAVMVGCAFAAVPAFGQEALGPAEGSVANLEAGFPTAIIDTTPTPTTAWEMGVAAGYVTNGAVYETAKIQVNYGIMEAVQVSAAWNAVLGEGLVAGNGDTTLSMLWAALGEDGNMPSMGLMLAGRLPTGDGFTGYDGTIAGAATKTVGEARFHLNVGYTTIGNNQTANRADADFVAIGMDYPILDDMVLVVDAYSAEAPVMGADRLEAIEAGIRTALSDIDTLSVGVSTRIGNGNATPEFTATVGYQRAL